MPLYTPAVSALVLRQINAEAQAALIYKTLALHFAHPSVSYPGFSRYFAHQAKEEEGHSEAFAAFHSQRGGFVCFGSLVSPLLDTELTFLRALEEVVLPLENRVYDLLLEVHCGGDEPTQIFTEDFIAEQTRALGELASLLTKARRMSGDAVALHLLDEEMREMKL